MVRRITFLDPDTGEQVTMPVTPTEWSLAGGREIETLAMAGPEERNVLGGRKLWQTEVEYILPVQPSSITAPGYLGWESWRPIIDHLKAWSKGGIVVRYIITGTRINLPVLIGSVEWGERGTIPDLWVRMSLHEYKPLAAGRAQSTPGTGNRPRPEPPRPVGKDTTYKVRQGDSLWIICRRHYGTGELYRALARYNGIKNPNFLSVGQVIRLPDRSKL